jgi:ketosteroid isomerase-like protein
MQTLATVSTLMVILVVPCYGQSRVPPDLQAAMRQRANALAQGDATTWARLTADNFVVISGSGALQTKSERVAQIKAGQPNGPRSVEHEAVQVYGNTAVQRFQSPQDALWVNFVWTKDRNGWRVTFAQLTPIVPDSASVWRAIDDINARFSASFMRGDVAGLASTYADSAVLMLSDGPAVEGGAAIRQAFTQFLADVTVPNFKLTTRDVMILPYTFIERGAYEMTIHPKTGTGADVVAKGKYLTVWEQQPDGSWKIVRDISNSDNPPPK